MSEEDSPSLPTRQVELRYGVCSKTIDRWENDPELEFPKSYRVNRRRYWHLADLVRWERARAAGKTVEEKSVGVSHAPT
jgi:predicted DNA-binding transcriptional regulator AlpA